MDLLRILCSIEVGELYYISLSLPFVLYTCLFYFIVELTAVNGSEDQSTNNEVTPTALEPEVELEPDDYETPIDSTLTEISDGPPRYRALFPPGYVPVKSEDELPPPPSYDESLRTSTENL